MLFTLFLNAQNQNKATKYSEPAAHVGDKTLTVPDVVRPVMDLWMRDTYVTLGPRGNYYMIGTTANNGKVDPDKVKYGDYNSGLFLWKSKNLKKWDSLGIIWSFKNDAESWQKKGNPVKGKDSNLVYRALWAPELHYIKSKETWLLTASLNGNQGSFVLKSISGKPEGPYENIAGNSTKPIFDNIDLSIFEDANGDVYLVAHNHFIARMKDDLTDIAEPFKRLVETPFNPEPYIEGAYLIKYNNKYHLLQTVWSVKQKDGTYTYLRKGDKNLHSYDVLIASADNIYGPYGPRYTAIIEGGHNNLFQDIEGNWWSTTFFNPRGIKGKEFEVTCRPALVPVKWVKNKLKPDLERARQFYDSF
jgi:hypothetical protein